MNKIDHTRAVVSGALATTMMTIAMMLAPLAGLPEMDFGSTLGMLIGGNTLAGWLIHLAIGVLLAWLYALLVHLQCLPGPASVRGAFYALYPWVVGELLVLPFLGAPVLGGSPIAVVASLVVHLLYGVAVGCIYGEGIVEASPVPSPCVAHPYRTPAPRPPNTNADADDASHAAERGPRSVVHPTTQLAATKYELTRVRAFVDEFERSLLRTEDAHTARAQLLQALMRLSCCSLDLAAAMVQGAEENVVSSEDSPRT